MPHLYELTSAYRQLEQLTDGDISEEDFFKAVDLIDGEMKEKAKNIGMFIENLETTAKAIKEAEQRMAARRETLQRRIASIKGYVLQNMQAAEITKIECDYFVLARQKNPPKCVIDDESKIPLQYMRQPEPVIPPPAPDKKALLEDMKAGAIFDGCHLEQGERLVIK